MEGSIGSGMSKYANTSMLAYVAFSLPAIILEALFSFSIASSPNLTSLGQHIVLGQGLVLLLTLVPWLVVLVSVYAVLTFRSSVVLTLLVLNYFLSSAVRGAITSASGFSLDPTTTAVAVVVATFLALIAFGFARSVKIRGIWRPIVSSNGSIPFQVLGLSFDFAVPAVIAVVLVVATIEMFGVVKSALAALPPPLSGIFTSNLTSPVVAVGATLAVAGITLWMVRELIEPWVMYYSITKEDAVKLLLADLKAIAKPSEMSAKKSGAGTTGSAAVILIIGVVLVLVFGPEAIVRNLPALFGGRGESYQSFVIQTNLWYNEIQDFIVQVIRLLWG